MSSAFEYVKEKMERSEPLNGHALINIENRRTLTIADAEIREMLRIKK